MPEAPTPGCRKAARDSIWLFSPFGRSHVSLKFGVYLSLQLVWKIFKAEDPVLLTITSPAPSQTLGMPRPLKKSMSE